MTKVSLIANKAMTYATRRLQAGDEFLASERDATILTYAKKAKRQRVPGRVDAPPASVLARVAPSEPGTEPEADTTANEPAENEPAGQPATPASRRRRKPRV